MTMKDCVFKSVSVEHFRMLPRVAGKDHWADVAVIREALTEEMIPPAPEGLAFCEWIIQPPSWIVAVFDLKDQDEGFVWPELSDEEFKAEDRVAEAVVMLEHALEHRSDSLTVAQARADLAAARADRQEARKISAKRWADLPSVAECDRPVRSR